MSEQILLLNPRRKRRHNRRRRARSRRGRMPAGLARYWASRRGTNPRRHKRRRHARHRRAANPRRRVLRLGRHYRARARRRNPRRRHHVARRRRSNPRFRLPSMGRGVIGAYVIPAGVGGLGGLVLDLAWGYISPKLPPSVLTGYAGLVAKFGVVLLAAFGMNRFVPRLRIQTNRAAIGAATVLAYGAIKGAAQSVLPATTPGLHGYIDYQSYALPGAGRLNGYMARTLGSLDDLYSPAAVIQPPGTPVPRQFGSLRGYIAVQPHMATGGGLMGYDWQNDGM